MYCKATLFFYAQIILLFDVSRSCIVLLNQGWKPMGLKYRTQNADVVVTAKILYTSAIPGYKMLHSATFEILSVLKGLEIIKTLYKDKSSFVHSLDPKIIAKANGFANTRCFSSVDVGESYALFLGFRKTKKQLVAKYDDLFGAAEILYKRTEREILQTLGWEEWSGWNICSKTCGRGTQERERVCGRSSKGACRGPKKEIRECNTFLCTNSFDLLTFITQYDSDFVPAWQRSGEIYTNGVQQKSPTSAPTYLLFPNKFPIKPVFRITFKGPIKKPQFLFSIFDANNKLVMGIKVTPHTISILYTSKKDSAYGSIETKTIVYEFYEAIWYDLSLLITSEEMKLKINCGELQRISVDNGIFHDMDIYGRMYLGASSNEGDARFVRAEMTQISVVDNPPTFWHQCGKLILNKNDETDETSGAGPSSGFDDSESGDVDEGFGSGNDNECNCENGGVCKSGRCKCPTGWKGDECETPLCENACLNEGFCYQPNMCNCSRGTYGNTCQFSHCHFPCQNNGTCIGPNHCSCKEGYNGSQCQNKVCATQCLNGASCTDDGKCVCTKSYTGERCQHKQKCKEYVIMLVSYHRPATVYSYITETVPCPDNLKLQCKKKKLKYQQINQISYRQEYVCKT